MSTQIPPGRTGPTRKSYSDFADTPQLQDIAARLEAASSAEYYLRAEVNELRRRLAEKSRLRKYIGDQWNAALAERNAQRNLSP